MNILDMKAWMKRVGSRLDCDVRSRSQLGLNSDNQSITQSRRFFHMSKIPVTHLVQHFKNYGKYGPDPVLMRIWIGSGFWTETDRGRIQILDRYGS
jgi:hypothetical protein